VKEHPRITRQRIAARAYRRIREADMAGQAAIAKAAAQAELRERLCAELKAKYAQRRSEV
jgi:hypothetical protein